MTVGTTPTFNPKFEYGGVTTGGDLATRADDVSSVEKMSKLKLSKP